MKKITVFFLLLCGIALAGTPAHALDLIKDIKGGVKKFMEVVPIPFIDQSPCKPYAYEVQRVCLRGDVELTHKQIEYTKGYAPNIIQCIHGKQEVWVDVLFLSNQYSIRLFDSEKGSKAFAGGTGKKYETALQRVRNDVCDKGKG